ncbi:frizzled-4-like [Onthophagus taurus]|uniref:frizzled-4-like n=1 Tax=Onthophagus taurus TaxID=166361 RepID=UPI0039BDD716
MTSRCDVVILLTLLIVGLNFPLISGLVKSKCERITVSMCQGIQYKWTMMPNLLGHTTQLDANIMLENFKGILNDQCSPYLRLFVCSVYVPLCSEHLPRAVPACRGLCEQVKTDCLPTLQRLNLSWPEEFNCSRFHEYSEQPNLCMQQPSDEEHLQETHHFGQLEIPLKNVRPPHHCPKNTIFSNNMCVKMCVNDSSSTDRLLYEVWTGVWSFFCLIVTSFALLTFTIEPKRFRWPARPILFLTICGFITSLVYLLRWIFGPYTCSGDLSILKPYDNWLCISIALVLTFCEFAFCIWWFIFCLVWYLSAAKEWSTEAIERTAPRLHALTWTVSIIPIIYALISNNIVINEFSGFCEVTTLLLIIFEMIFTLLGAILAVLTSVALKNVRKTLIYAGKSPYKLERLIYRLGIISLGICLPLFICLMCYFLDNLTVALLKVCLKLLSAVFAAIWVFSSKTFKRWNKIIRPSFTHKDLTMPVTKV